MIHGNGPIIIHGEPQPDLKCFSYLSKNLKSKLKNFGIRTPTVAQAIAIKPILEGKNVLLIAPTGSGKTEAVMLPVFDRIYHSSGTNGIRAIYITPLRALNRDLMQRLKSWAETIGLRILIRHGDTPTKDRNAMARNPPDILITTPETLQVMLSGKRIRQGLKSLEIVIIDEVHELISTSRGAQLSMGLERLKAAIGHGFQRIGLSATVGDIKSVAAYVAGSEKEIYVLNASGIKEYDIDVVYSLTDESDRAMAMDLDIKPESIGLVKRIADEIKKRNAVLVFSNTRDGAEFIGSILTRFTSERFAVHHGSLSREFRIEIEDKFKSGDLKALIATSSLELGIDIGHVDFAIQCSSPRTVSRLLQRIGRSGHRVGAKAKGMMIATDWDDFAECIIIKEWAKHGRLENLDIRYNPLDVLANQIAAHVYTEKCTKSKELYSIIRGSYIFHGLSWDKYLATLRELCLNRVISIPDTIMYEALMTFKPIEDDFTIRPGRKIISYFYSNISMIPDEAYYIAIDIQRNKSIGKLDESFVVSDCSIGMTITLGGNVWRVVDIKEHETSKTKDKNHDHGPIGTVLLDPLHGIGELPRWCGEEIPVPYEIAMEVGRLRRSVIEGNHIPDILARENRYLGEKFAAYITSAYEKGFDIATDKSVVIEGGKGLIVINATMGHKVNTTLAHLISLFIAEKTGSISGINADAYRAVLFFEGTINPSAICDYLHSIKYSDLNKHISDAIVSSTRFRWVLYQVARKFGAVGSTATTKLTRLETRKLISLLGSDIIKTEAIEKEMFSHMDIQKTIDVIKKINSGEIALYHNKKLSPISMCGPFYTKGIIAPEYADYEILIALKNRLLSEVLRACCLNCGTNYRVSVKDLYNSKKLGCNYCGGKMMALLPLKDGYSITVLRKYLKKGDKTLNTEEIRTIKKLYKNANVVLNAPKIAPLLLAARGIGVDTAARIIFNLSDPEDEVYLLREILRAEITFARTRRFWD